LSGIAVSSAVMAYGLIIFGSQVRVSDSGMGCPDWPLCEGKLGPLQEFHALMEQTHRYLAAMVTVLVLTTAMLAWRNRSRSAAIRPALFTVAVIVVQIGLGALTVIAGNGAPTVAAHLLAALAMLAGATITAVAALVPLRPTTGRRLGRLCWTAISAAGVLFVSGSLVVNAEAEKACASFPLCPSGQPGGMVALHLIHRAVAVLAGTALLTFAVHAWRHWSVPSGARALAAALVALVVATASLGIVSALLKAPPGWQDLHLAGAAAVLAVSMALAALGWLTGADSRPAEGRPETNRPVPARPAASTGTGINRS
jgi:heme A synthase